MPETSGQTQLAVARRVLLETRIEGSQITAIGIANQRETTLLWDRAHQRAACPCHRVAGQAQCSSLQ